MVISNNFQVKNLVQWTKHCMLRNHSHLLHPHHWKSPGEILRQARPWHIRFLNACLIAFEPSNTAMIPHSLTYFSPVVHFHTPLKRQKTKSFLGYRNGIVGKNLKACLKAWKMIYLFVFLHFHPFSNKLQ